MRTAWRQIPGSIRILSGCTFLMFFGFFAVIPNLTLYLTQNFGWSMGLAGLLLGIRQFSQQGLMFLGGMIADRVGLRETLIVGLLVRGIGFFAFAVCDTTAGFFTAAILSGLGGALFDPAEKALFESLTPREHRAEIIAFRNVVSNLGFVASGLIGVLLVEAHFPVLASFAGIAFVTVATIVGRNIPSIPVGQTQPPWLTFRRVAADRAFLKYTLLLTGYYFLAAQLYLLLPRAVFDTTGSKRDVTWLYVGIALLVATLQWTVSHRVKTSPNRFRLIGIGSGFLGLSIFTAGMIHGDIVVGISAALFAAGLLLAAPVIFEVVGLFAPRHLLGSYYGFNGWAQGFGGAMSTAFGGWLYDLGQGLSLPSLPWVFCLVFAGWVAWAMVRFGKTFVAPPPS